MGNNELIPSLGVGTVRTVINVNGRVHNVVLQDVLYASEIACNLNSVSKTCRKDITIRIDSDSLSHRRGLTKVVDNISGESKMICLESDDGPY